MSLPDPPCPQCRLCECTETRICEQDLLKSLREQPQPGQFQSLTRLYTHLVTEREKAAEVIEAQRRRITELESKLEKLEWKM